jgi:hypothetical protein
VHCRLLVFSSLSVKILDVENSTNVFIALEWRYMRQERFEITSEILTGKFYFDKFGRSHYKEESNSYWDMKFSNTS